MPMGAFRLNDIGKYQIPVVAGYTIPTSEFTTDTNTKILYKFDTNFADYTARTPKTITANGNAKISTAQSKFGGSSALFDGAGSPVDSLTIPANTDFAHGTGDFTYEAWIYPTARGTFPTIFASTNFTFATNSSGYLYAYIGGNLVSTGAVTTLNAWNHVAFVKTSGVFKMFLNGTQRYSATQGTSMTSSTTFFIGNDGGTAYGFVGYIDEVRVSNIARYTTNFTAPTAAFTNDSNTLLLLHMDGMLNSTIFTDGTGTSTIAYYEPTRSSTVKQFGTGSLIADGSTNFPSVYTTDSLTNYVFANKDFTCEAWVNYTSFTNVAYGWSGGVPKTITFGDGTNNTLSWGFGANYNGTIRLLYWNGSAASILESSTPISLGVWNHIAFDHRVSDGRMRLLVNGQIAATSTRVGSFTSTVPQFRVGGFWASDSTTHWTGFVDEVRVSHSLRY